MSRPRGKRAGGPEPIVVHASSSEDEDGGLSDFEPRASRRTSKRCIVIHGSSSEDEGDASDAPTIPARSAWGTLAGPIQPLPRAASSTESRTLYTSSRRACRQDEASIAHLDCGFDCGHEACEHTDGVVNRLSSRPRGVGGAGDATVTVNNPVGSDLAGAEDLEQLYTSGIDLGDDAGSEDEESDAESRYSGEESDWEDFFHGWILDRDSEHDPGVQSNDDTGSDSPPQPGPPLLSSPLQPQFTSSTSEHKHTQPNSHSTDDESSQQPPQPSPLSAFQRSPGVQHSPRGQKRAVPYSSDTDDDYYLPPPLVSSSSHHGHGVQPNMRKQQLTELHHGNNTGDESDSPPMPLLSSTAAQFSTRGQNRLDPCAGNTDDDGSPQPPETASATPRKRARKIYAPPENCADWRKVCKDCKEEKTYAEFVKDKRSPSGTASMCNTCRKAADRQVINTNRETFFTHRVREIHKRAERMSRRKRKCGSGNDAIFPAERPNITIEHLERAYQEQGGLCYLCGQEMVCTMTARGEFMAQQCSVDRIDSTRAYSEGNFILACKKCNYMRYELSRAQFIAHCGVVTEHQARIRSRADGQDSGTTVTSQPGIQSSSAHGGQHRRNEDDRGQAGVTSHGRAGGSVAGHGVLTSSVQSFLKTKHRYTKGRARKRGIECTLILDDVVDLYICAQGKSAISGRVMETHAGGTATSRCSPWGLSFDRINPKLGYTKSNVRLVCWVENAGLLDHGDELYFTHARLIQQRWAGRDLPTDTFAHGPFIGRENDDNMKPVDKYLDKDRTRLIAEYTNVQEAVLSVGASSEIGHVLAQCRGERLTKTRGFYFSFKENRAAGVELRPYDPEVDGKVYAYSAFRPVLQIDPASPADEVVEWFPNARAAGKALDIKPSDIHRCARGYRRTTSGYGWKYADTL